MKRMLLATTAAVACLMLTPSAEARSASRPEHAVAVSVEAGNGAGDGFVAVAQAAPDDEDDEEDGEDEEDDDEEDDSEDEEDENEEDEDEDDEDDGSATADPDPDPDPGAVTGGQDDIAVDDADADEHEDENEDEGEEDDPFPGVPGTLNATIGGTAILQAGVFGDLTHGVQFRNKTELDFNVRGKADNGLLYGLKLQLETVTGHESSSETTFDEAYVYIGGTWGRLEFGDTDDVVAGGLVIYAPSVGIGQIDGDYGSFSRLSLDDYYPFYPDIGTSTKINYYTPRIAGFQAGISYSPHLADNGQSVVAFRPGRVRATTASAPSRSLSSASAVPRTAIQTASLGPRTVTRASAPPPARAAQTVDDDEDDGEDSEDDSDGDDEGEDDEGEGDEGEDDEGEDDEGEDDGSDDGPDTDEPGTPDPPTPEQPTPEQPSPEQPSPEQPSPEQPGPGEPTPPVPPVVEPQPETPVVEEPDDEDEPESGYRDVTSFAVNYQKEFETLTFSGSAAVMNGNGYGPGFKDFTAWVTGVQIGISDFTVGGGFGKFDGYADLDWQWNVGATYETGPFGIGAQYAWARDVNGDHSWAAGIGVNYVLAPGLSLQADYVHSKVGFERSGDVNTSDIVLIGLQLSF
jgi:predicted porin